MNSPDSYLLNLFRASARFAPEPAVLGVRTLHDVVSSQGRLEVLVESAVLGDEARAVARLLKLREGSYLLDAIVSFHLCRPLI